MSCITAIGTAAPPNRFDQNTLADFMVRVMRADEVQTRKIRAVFRGSGIRSRHSVLEDYGRTDHFSIYPNNDSGKFPGTQQRMRLYQEHALPLSIAAVGDLVGQGASVHDVTHLVVVSCTGMYAPGLDIDLIKHFRLPTSTERICINFMGCYAAFNGLKAADAICKSNDHSKVLVVCTELCSIHFQPDPSDDNILANALFADGSAAMLVQQRPSGNKAFSLEMFHSELALNGERDMAWSISDFGFEMRLSSYIPDLLRKEIRSFVDSLLNKIKGAGDNIKYYAFHPGGKKILEAIEMELDFGKDGNQFAYNVLERFGNMSSPTVVFVLREILDHLTPEDNDGLVLSAAFGPGLTLESMLLKAKVHA